MNILSKENSRAPHPLSMKHIQSPDIERERMKAETFHTGFVME